MPWKESSTMSQRQEFVMLASADNANIRQLCRRFGISPTIGYKWLGRYQTDGLAGLKDQSRRPKNSPRRSSDKVEQAVVKLRQKHPTWGGRKLCARLKALKEPEVPSASTITAMLHRHQLITPEATEQHKPYQRFEHPHPNDLWQMDFKGYFALRASTRSLGFGDASFTLSTEHSGFPRTIAADRISARRDRAQGGSDRHDQVRKPETIRGRSFSWTPRHASPDYY